ncbi:MAG: helix-turn-helix domain-containing protein [Ruminococcaceae bacterium]|nr:helix-turn-helix domain-containing protein [Oscillospiraceae bacterium]
MDIIHEKTKNHIMYSRKRLPTNILHWHQSIELCRAISGNATFIVDNIEYNFKPGDVVIIPSKCLHKFVCSEKNLVDIFLIPTHEFMPIIRHYPSIPIHIPREKILSIDGLEEQLNDLFYKINKAYSLNIPFSQTLSLSYALSLTSLLLMYFPPLKIIKQKNFKYLFPVLEEIKSDCTNPEYSLKYFSKKLGYTPEYFSSMFKKFTGIGFKDFLDRQRIDEAKRIMLSNDLPISLIAEHCGFNNSRTFNNRFMALENMTPTQFIELYSTESENNYDIIF